MTNWPWSVTREIYDTLFEEQDVKDTREDVWILYHFKKSPLKKQQMKKKIGFKLIELIFINVPQP